VFGDTSHLEGGVAGVEGGGLGRHDLCCVFEEYATSKRWIEQETSKGICVLRCIDLVDDINFRTSSVGVSGKSCQESRLPSGELLRHVAATRRELHRPNHRCPLTTTLTRHLPSPSSLSISRFSGHPHHLRIHIHPRHDLSLYTRVTPKPPPPCPAPRVPTGRSIRRSLPTMSPKRRRSLPCPMRISKSSRHTAPLPTPPPSRSSRRRSRTVRQASTTRLVSRYYHSPLLTHLGLHTHALAGVRHRSRPSASLGYRCR
jgi:hypothetical protein